MNALDTRPHAPRRRLARTAYRLALIPLVVGFVPTVTQAAEDTRPRPTLDAVAPALAISAASGLAPQLATTVVARPATALTALTIQPAIQPTVQYEEAIAHAGDRIAFSPGGRVTVPYTPRPDDGWIVAGSPPRPLPTGGATGRDMAAAPQGSAGTESSSPHASSVPVRIPSRLEALGTIGSPPPSAGIRPAAAKGLRRQVFGFLPWWELADPSTRLDYDLLSTVAYFSVGVAPDGDLLKRNPDGTVTTGWAGWTSARLTDVIDTAHRRRTRVVLTLSMFAWTTGGADLQGAFLGSPAARQNLARQVAAAVRDRGADGVNLDFEPLVGGHEDDFVALVRAIRSELDRKSPGYQLTFDTMGRIGNYPVDAATAPGGADAVFVMGYDYRTAGSPVAGSIAPLDGPAYDLTETVLSYLDEVPASRIILGVPWYGRAWSTQSDALNSPTQTGPKFGPSVPVPYAQAVGAAATHDARWDDREQVAWFTYRRSNCTSSRGCATSWRQVYFDDDRALRLKYDLVNRTGIRGVGIWALGYDGGHREVWNALADKFLRDTTPPEAGIRIFPGDVRDEGFIVDWTARDDYNDVVSYDVQASVDGGPWSAWLTATKAGADVWLGHDGHGYAFRVRAKDGKKNLGAWDTATTYVADPTLEVGGFARVAIDGLTARARPATSAKPRDTLEAGTIVALADGPVNAGGYTWYEIVEPILEWSPVSSVRGGLWVAASGAGAAFLTPVRAPNSTRVVAGISGLSFNGAGPASVGPTPAAASRRAFSPNGDGSQDTLRLDWKARVPFDALTLDVYRPDGTPLGSEPVAARAAGDQSFDWDGHAGGAVLPDGTYVLELVGSANGATYTAPSARPVTIAQLGAYGVTIDTVAPTSSKASISGRRVSPNGDGRFDALVVTGSAKGGNWWDFSVAGLADGVPGVPVRRIHGAGSNVQVTWDGRAGDGSVVPDGSYRVTLRNLDWAGNGPAATWDVVVDARDPVVVTSAAPLAISPNGDGADDRAAISWTSDEPAGGWIRILHGKTLVRRWHQALGNAGKLAWDGRDANGRQAADGRYLAEIELTDASGNRVVQRQAVVVDRAAGTLRWNPPAFLPGDGDKLAVTTDVSFNLARSATTSLRVEDRTGRIVRNAWRDRKRGPGTVTWTWDGRDAHHGPVPAGRYVAVLTVESPLGTTELRRTVVIDAFLVTSSASELTTGDTLKLTFRSVEPLRTIPTVTFTQAGLAAVKVKATKTGPGAYTASVSVVVGAGPATVVIAGRDSGGGTNVTRLAVSVS